MMHFDLFLSYKIERAVRPADESDALHGLFAVSSAPETTGDLHVSVSEQKSAIYGKLTAIPSGELDLAASRLRTCGRLRKRSFGRAISLI